VPLSSSTWERLCALAARRQQNRGDLAARLLATALKGVRIVDGNETGQPDGGLAGVVEQGRGL
jgi:hypothetical protein